MEFRINHLEALYWLWAVAGLALLLLAGALLRWRDLARFAAPNMHARLVDPMVMRRRRLRGVLLVGAATALVAALLDPRWGVSYRQVPRRGVDIMVVLDVSRSMLAEDARPNRLERARILIGDLVEQLAGDRIGLVAFAGVATVKCPLTVDYGAFRLALSMVDPRDAPRGGSLLGDGLRVAAEAFTDEVPDHKVIVLFSDGEDHGSYPVEAARAIGTQKSIPVYAVAIGDAAEGARIPQERDGKRLWLLHEGREVWSKLDADLLREVALQSGGAYVPVGTGTVDIARLYEERIEPAATRQVEGGTVKQHHARYQWFAGLALLLIVAESWMGEGRGVARMSWRHDVGSLEAAA
jgi:Ca-activated chloride channel family protein